MLFEMLALLFNCKAIEGKSRTEAFFRHGVRCHELVERRRAGLGRAGADTRAQLSDPQCPHCK